MMIYDKLQHHIALTISDGARPFKEGPRTVTNQAPAEASLTRPWPADRVERWPIERLIPYANNPRLHSEADLDKLDASIRKWGWTMPVLVDEEGDLIAGALRV